MKKKIRNYETLLKITQAISHSKDPEEVVIQTVAGIKDALDAKACALFLINRKNHELEIAATNGLSKEYINKGPLSAMKSIAGSLKDGPVAIYDATNDPRIQYPDAAKKEGIHSILSVPIIMREKVFGAVRVYTSEPWEATQDDLVFVQALAQMAGIAVEMSRIYQGQKDAIGVLKRLRKMQTDKEQSFWPPSTAASWF